MLQKLLSIIPIERHEDAFDALIALLPENKRSVFIFYMQLQEEVAPHIAKIKQSEKLLDFLRKNNF